METNFKTKLYSLLKKDARLWDEEKRELNETLLKDFIDKLDKKLIEILLDDHETREMFFIKIKDVYVLKQNDLKFFVDENKLDNSYTQYQNKIGLRVGNKLLSELDEVVLDWPFKDCVLEGGMTKEDQKRNEIFFNEVLAKDEIDRLKDPKILVNWNRCTAKGEEKVKELKRDKDSTIRENLIIKGNNLLALHSLKEQFTGKVKLVYIDPPYNTEGAANTFTYNNTFNHSTWLTFVKNRAEVSKNLLKKDGFFAIAIDHVELFYVGVLLDEIFGRENRIGVVAVETNPRGRSDSTFFATSHEYLLVYALNNQLASINNLSLTNEQVKNFNLEDDASSYRLLPFRRSGSNSTPKERPNLFYPIYFDPKTGDMSLIEKSDYKKIEPIDTAGGPRVWRQSKIRCKDAIECKDLVIKENQNGGFSVYLKDRIKDGRKAKTFWSNPKYDSSSHGTILLKDLLGDKLFSYPKSLYLMEDILKILTNNEDIVLDYHAGSGTTGHAVLNLNEEDKGNRKFILIEQMEYVQTVTIPRVKAALKRNKSIDDFVYCELAKWNEEAKEKILKAKNLSELEKLFDELYERYFLNYNVKTKEFKEKTIKEGGFKNLDLDKQKKLFVEMLDMNQMYVNFSERADKKYALSKEDIALSEEFYNVKK